MDTSSVLLPALLSLLGVGMGTVGTLVGQHLSTRASARQHHAQQWAAQRAELKAAILRFLSKVQQVAPIDDRNRPAPDRSIDELWLAQQELDLVAVSERVRGAAYRYARRVTASARSEPGDGDSDGDALPAAQREFMDAARLDLWPVDLDVSRSVRARPGT